MYNFVKKIPMIICTSKSLTVLMPHPTTLATRFQNKKTGFHPFPTVFGNERYKISTGNKVRMRALHFIVHKMN